jgi:hypothetical protein
MVTNAEDTLPEVDSPSERAEGLVRYAISGHERGAVRRILLYVAVVIALLVASESLDAAPFAAVAGVLALLLLAVTDQYA